MFSKGYFLRVVKSRDCVVKSYITANRVDKCPSAVCAGQHGQSFLLFVNILNVQLPFEFQSIGGQNFSNVSAEQVF